MSRACARGRGWRMDLLQVDALRRLRGLADPERPEAAALRDVIVLTINGIWAGLRNTG